MCEWVGGGNPSFSLVICLWFDCVGALFDFGAPFNHLKSANVLRHSCEQRITAIGERTLEEDEDEEKEAKKKKKKKKRKQKRNGEDGQWCTSGNRILRQLPAFHPRLSRRCFSVSNEALMHA